MLVVLLLVLLPSFIVLRRPLSVTVAVARGSPTSPRWPRFALCSAVHLPPKNRVHRAMRGAPPLGIPSSSSTIKGVVSHPLIRPRPRLWAAGLVGLAISRRPSLKMVLRAALAGSVLFDAITNVLSWFIYPVTSKFRWPCQALTVGLPQDRRHPDLDVLRRTRS